MQGGSVDGSVYIQEISEILNSMPLSVLIRLHNKDSLSLSSNINFQREIVLVSFLYIGSFHINSTNELNHDVTKFDKTWLIASFLRFE